VRHRSIRPLAFHFVRGRAATKVFAYIECVSSECTALLKAFVVADKSPEEHNDAQKQICFAARFCYRGAHPDCTQNSSMSAIASNRAKTAQLS
jgi:hypothetical protein